MQQMNPEETNSGWRDSYGRYEGNAQQSNESNAQYPGQKLESDDEQFADILIRKIKQELRNEPQPNKVSTVSARLILAIVSLCLLVFLFGLLILAFAFGHVASDAVPALGAGMFFICGAVMAVNGYFNWASTAISKSENSDKNNNDNSNRNGK